MSQTIRCFIVLHGMYSERKTMQIQKISSKCVKLRQGRNDHVQQERADHHAERIPLPRGQSRGHQVQRKIN